MQHDFQNDIDTIASISAVPSILDVVCRMTGMRFAAVARVTEGRWIACATKDEISFGLAPGGELKVETTICHEIRQNPEPVVIEDVSGDEAYCQHPTPAMYGFRSYASFPIVLPDGTFFGTLCAIDPEPRGLKSEQMIGTFKLFAELIAYHLDSERKLTETRHLLQERREWERRQRILQRELSHRMKNTLAMVQAVVTQSLRNATSIEEASHQASDRIQALARAQDALTATDWSAADVETIVRASVAPLDDGGKRFVVSGPPVELEAQRSLGLALAIHELATNATKYGALSNETGVIEIRWTVSGDNRFSFSWMEVQGPPVRTPMRQGFGSRLTERVVPSYFEGQAEVEYASTGFRYTLVGTLGAGRPSHARD